MNRISFDKLFSFWGVGEPNKERSSDSREESREDLQEFRINEGILVRSGDKSGVDIFYLIMRYRWK